MGDERTTDASRKKWDHRYRQKNTQPQQPPEACPLLSNHRHLLPTEGEALDLACGRGGNALLMAEVGLHVTACDISAEACKQAAQHGKPFGKKLRCLNDEAAAALGTAQRYDVIVISRFLDRSLIPLTIRALRPEGLLFHQTFGIDAVDGPTNPAYRLDHNELLALYTHPLLHIIHYDEPSLLTPSNGLAGLITRRHS